MILLDLLKFRHSLLMAVIIAILFTLLLVKTFGIQSIIKKYLLRIISYFLLVFGGILYLIANDLGLDHSQAFGRYSFFTTLIAVLIYLFFFRQRLRKKRAKMKTEQDSLN